jgi:hypothetical protein
MWMEKIATTADSEVRRGSIERAKFIREQILNVFSISRIQQLHGFDPSALDEQERLLPADLDDADTRSPSELVIATELRRADADSG